MAISGEVGTGKTTLCRTLLERLGSSCEIAFLFNPTLGPTDLIKAINAELGLSTFGDSRTELLDVLNTFLLDKHAEGRRVLVIIDEAQNLPVETLEQLRLLSNLETHTAKLLQIVLIGQPELDAKLDAPELRQLRQRIGVWWQLGPLERDETREYVEHRLRVAGGSEPIFSPSALRAGAPPRARRPASGEPALRSRPAARLRGRRAPDRPRHRERGGARGAPAAPRGWRVARAVPRWRCSRRWSCSERSPGSVRSERAPREAASPARLAPVAAAPALPPSEVDPLRAAAARRYAAGARPHAARRRRARRTALAAEPRAERSPPRPARRSRSGRPGGRAPRGDSLEAADEALRVRGSHDAPASGPGSRAAAQARSARAGRAARARWARRFALLRRLAGDHADLEGVVTGSERARRPRRAAAALDGRGARRPGATSRGCRRRSAPGDEGPPVAWVQDALARLAFYSGDPHGRFDADTRARSSPSSAAPASRSTDASDARTKLALYRALPDYALPLLADAGARRASPPARERVDAAAGSLRPRDLAPQRASRWSALSALGRLGARCSSTSSASPPTGSACARRRRARTSRSSWPAPRADRLAFFAGLDLALGGRAAALRGATCRSLGDRDPRRLGAGARGRATTSPTPPTCSASCGWWEVGSTRWSRRRWCPVVSHFLVMLVQMTLALPFLRGAADRPSRRASAWRPCMWALVRRPARRGVWLSRSRPRCARRRRSRWRPGSSASRRARSRRSSGASARSRSSTSRSSGWPRAPSASRSTGPRWPRASPSSTWRS